MREHKSFQCDFPDKITVNLLHIVYEVELNATVVWNYEEDVAAYTIRAVMDSRTLNKTIICRPLRNIASQLDFVSSWEEKTGLTLNRIHMLEDDLINLTQSK